MTRLHINWARYDHVWEQVNPCPTCASEQPMVGAAQEWYGTTWTCLGCGDRFADGERLERPFAPKWREKRIVEARALLARGAP